MVAMLAGLSTPALAQHSDHDPHAGHVMSPAPPPTPAPVPAPAPAPASALPDPHAGHVMPPPVAEPPLAPPPPAALSGPAHAADTIYDPAQMAAARAAIPAMHGGATAHKVAIERLEWGVGTGSDGYAWSGYGWSGGDIDRLWVKSEGEGDTQSGLERAEVQALWSHAIAPFWDVQVGVRQDIGTGPETTHAVIGVQGLAPYWFHVDAALFVSHRGDVTARVEAAHDIRLTQVWILQPRAEIELAAQDVPRLGIGSGLNSAELGARLRYQVTPHFAPYAGVEYARAFGNSTDFRRNAGERVGAWRFLLGISGWF
ncbi:MAG: copper resistance protein B [Sphingopyxis sp.]